MMQHQKDTYRFYYVWDRLILTGRGGRLQNGIGAGGGGGGAGQGLPIEKGGGALP